MYWQAMQPNTGSFFILLECNEMKMRNGGIFCLVFSGSVLNLNLGFAFDGRLGLVLRVNVRGNKTFRLVYVSWLPNC